MFDAIFDFIRGIFFMESKENSAIRLIDHKKAARRLKIRKLAADMGRKNLPAPDENTPSHLDKAIKSFYEQKIINNHAELLQKVGSYRDALLKRNDLKSLSAIRNLPEKYMEDLETGKNRGREELKRVEAELEWAERELEKFRADNCIDYRAIPEKGAETLVNLKWIVPATGDFLMNLTLFAQILSGFTGIFVALSIAAVNSILAFLMGRGIRRLNLGARINKTAGTLYALLLASIVPFNFLFAHIRGVAMSLVHEAGVLSYAKLLSGKTAIIHNALNSLVHHPFSGVLNFEALLFLGLGMSIASWSAYAGWNTSEKYPGLARRYGRVQELGKKAEAIRENMRLHAVRLKKSHDLKLEQTIRDEKSRIRATMELHESFISLAHHELQKYELRLKDCLGGYEYCIQLARNENLMHRSDGKRPIGFNYPAAKIQLPALDISTVNEEARLREMGSVLETIDEEKKRISQQLQDLCNRERQVSRAEPHNAEKYRQPVELITLDRENDKNHSMKTDYSGRTRA